MTEQRILVVVACAAVAIAMVDTSGAIAEPAIEGRHPCARARGLQKLVVPRGKTRRSRHGLAVSYWGWGT